MQYRIVVHDGNDVPLGEFTTYRNLTLGKRLNNYGRCSFEIPASDVKASDLVALRVYQVYIYRDGVLFWGGEQAIRDGNLDDKGNNWCTITCFTWFEQLMSRYTAALVNYVGIDAAQIAWDLIDTTQGASDFGITEGTLEATQNRDRTYSNDKIGELIINLSNVINGFDFEITDSKIFNASAMIGVDRTNLVLEYGRNMQSCQINEDASSLTNRAIVIGNSGDFSSPIRVDRDDAGSQTTYKLREGLTNEMDVSEQQTLEDKGDALLRKKGLPLFKISFRQIPSSFPTIADFALGDLITVKVKSGIYDINRTFRVYEWNVRVTKLDTEEVDLVLGDFIV